MSLMGNYFKEADDWFNGKTREVIDTCLVCGHRQLINKDFISTKSLFTECKCGFVWNCTPPTQNVLDNFYKTSNAMDSWSKIKQTENEEQRQINKYIHVWNKISRENLDTILDVGCGTGFFLNRAPGRVLRIGIEPHPESAQFCKYPTYQSFQHLKTSIHGNKKFKLITLFGVLEHLKDPMGELIKYEDMLDEGGYICAIVPNVSSLVVKTLKDKCSTFCHQHLWYFNVDTLVKLVSENTGFVPTSYLTIEPEVQPVLRKLNGFEPYDNIGIELTHDDINPEKVLENSLGYKIIAYFQRDNEQLHKD